MAQQPFLGRLALAVGAVLFSISSAFSDQLAPLGDFSSSNPILTPTASCNAGGRSFILARPNDDSTRLAHARYSLPPKTKERSHFWGRAQAVY